MSEEKKSQEPRISMHVVFDVKESYSHKKILNINVQEEPIPTHVDPVEYIVSRLKEELRRQAALVKAQYTPEEAPKVADDIDSLKV